MPKTANMLSTSSKKSSHLPEKVMIQLTDVQKGIVYNFLFGKCVRWFEKHHKEHFSLREPKRVTKDLMRDVEKLLRGDSADKLLYRRWRFGYIAAMDAYHLAIHLHSQGFSARKSLKANKAV
jgi:hypothetical protein